MKAYKSVLSFCLLLVAIRRGNSLFTPLDEKTVCKNGKLVQYTNFFACLCNKGLVHTKENECEAAVASCTKEDEICGEYAKCTLDSITSTYNCKCISGYEANGETPAVCIPRGCKAFDTKCAGGKCIKKDDNNAQCGCFIGKKPGIDKDCVEEKPDAECKLTCAGENTACVVAAKEYYECGCKKGYELKNGKCVKKEESDGAGFPKSGFLNVGVLFLASSIVYVFV